LDFSTAIIDASSFNVGLWGYYEIMESRLQAEWILHKSWFALGRLGNNKLPGNLEINAGANYFLTSATKQKNMKVVLKTKHYDNGSEITFITVPGKVYINKGVRGGVYSKTNPYIIDYEKVYPNVIGGTDFEGKMSTTGIYLGGIINRTTNMFIETKEYGKHYNSVGHNYYADILILPLASFSPLNPFPGLDEEAEIKTNLGRSLGFRIGWKIFQVAPKKMTGKKFGMSANFEAGVKPYLGLFFNGGIGITLFK
jgi:hypothetical protein